MFSMFFGAGNSIFPLLVGIESGQHWGPAILGFILTAVCVPIMGVVAMIYFRGNYDAFFFRLGKVPGAALIAFLICLIGPFVALPRCITLSYSTLALYVPQLPLWVFSAISCAVIYISVMRRGRLLALLGYVLTPLLLFGMLTIIGAGLYNPPSAPEVDVLASTAFFSGLEWGYNTLDLIAAFFFSSVVMTSLARQMGEEGEADSTAVFQSVMGASLITAVLLGVIYAGFGMVAASYSENLSIVNEDQVLGAVAFEILGPMAGIFATITIIMACFTTEITLAQVFGTYLSEEVFRGKVHYRWSLVITLLLTFGISLLGFSQIVAIVKPVVFHLYPTIIVIALVNLLHKLFGFKPVKLPALLTFLATVLYYQYPSLVQLLSQSS